jgi:hypothetical protein
MVLILNQVKNAKKLHPKQVIGQNFDNSNISEKKNSVFISLSC